MKEEDVLKKPLEAFKNGDYQKTISICENLVKSFNNSKIYNLYGLALQKNNLFKGSIEKFNQALKIDPNNYEIYNNLAISFKYNSQLNLSQKMYEKCLEINPNYLVGIINYALLKEQKNEIEEAIKHLLKSLTIKPNPNIIFVLNKLTLLHLSIGKFKDAKSFALKSIDINPYDINSYKTLSDLTDHKNNKSIIKKMEEMIIAPQITKQGEIILSFSLGKAYGSINNFSKAFSYFERGNELKKQITKSNLNELIKLKKNIIEIFKNLNLSKINKNCEKKNIIFIIGMPRSGTTLIDQIISSHNEVISTGENGFLLKVIVQNFLRDNQLQKKLIKKDLLNKLNLIQKEYLKIVIERNIKSDIFTDKSLENIFFLGFIKIYFPNSKIILTEREFKNIFWSIYKTNFRSNYMNWTYDKREIISYFKIYKELVEFWNSLIPKDIYRINYENLIDNQHYEIKKLIKFCDLKWDSRCLDHQKNISIIKSASVLQARKPIYKSSKNSTENYSIYLKDMFKIIDNNI